MKKPDILTAIEPVVNAFEELGILYYIGGSVASSAYGIARMTLDVDMVTNLMPQHVRPFAETLKSAYYIDEEMILDAIHQRSSFNIIHLETMIKVDIFVTKDRPYNNEVFTRKRKETLDEEQGTAEFYLASSEDVILNKLEWYNIGGELSERHWNDVLGVIKVQADLLDKGYLSHWASELGLSELLEKALRDSGIDR
jgi:hypothetical protein